MRSVRSLTLIVVTAALIGSATDLQPVNAQSQVPLDGQRKQTAEAVAHDSDSANPRVPKAGLVGPILDSFDNEPGLSYEEYRALLKLSDIGWPEKREIVRLGLSEERYVDQLQIHAFHISHAVIALDPSGELSEDLLQSVLRPVIENHESSDKRVATALELLMYLRVDDSDRIQLLLEWLNDDRHNPSQLGEVLSSYAFQMQGDDAAAMATILVNRLVADPDQHNFEIVGSMESLAEALPEETLMTLVQRLVPNCERGQDTRAFIALASNLEAADLIPITETILEFMRDEQDHQVLASHAWILRDLSAKLDADAILPIRDLLLDRLETQKDVYPVNMLSSALADAASKLEGKDLQTTVDTLIQRIKADSHISTRRFLVAALGSLAANLEAVNLKPVADLLVDEICNQHAFHLEESSKTVEAWADKLHPMDRVRHARAILNRIAVERDSAALHHLGRAFTSLVTEVDANGARPLGTALIQQIEADQVSSDRFVKLCELLGTLAEKLPPDELLPVASSLVTKISSEKEIYQREQLTAALLPIAKGLTAQQKQTFVTQLVDRMESEDEAEMLVHLAWILDAMSSSLAEPELQAAIAAIAKRIELEQMTDKVENLIIAFEPFIERMEPAAIRSFAMDLVTRLSVERDGNELIMLSQLIQDLSAHMSPGDLSRARTVMVERLENRRDGEIVMHLAEVIASLPGRSDSDRGEAEVLLASLAQAIYPDPETSYYYYDDEPEQLTGLQSFLVEAELQSLVDALKAPLLADELVAEAIFGAIEDKIGRSFDGGLWAFVDWATTDSRGMILDLDLAGAGPWALFEEPEPVEFPPLQGITFQQQGKLELKGAVQSLVVEGDVAYVTAGVSGLRLIDISDPANPRVVGHADAGPHAMAVCVAGDYAYVTAGPAGWPEAHLHVVDISAAAKPRIVGSIDLPDYPSGVAVKDNLVYVADHTEGLRIIDVSDPRMPKEAGFLRTPGYIVDVSLAGNYAILADTEVGLRAVDISAPEDPKEVGLFRTEGPCLDVCIEDDRAYAATGEGGLVVVDISNPRSLKKIATISTEVAVSVSVQNKLAVVGAAKFGFRVFDLTDLANPTAYDLKVSANGVASFLHSNSLLLSDASVGGMPYGVGNQTILRSYKMIGPNDAEPGIDKPKMTEQSPLSKTLDTPTGIALAAAGEEWGDVMNVSNDETPSIMPALDVDGEGNVHLAWMGKSKDNVDIFYSRWTADDDWSPPRNISNSASHSGFPSLVVDKQGTAILVWMESQGNESEIHSSLGSGAKWSEPMNISNRKGISQPPKLVLSSAGIAHAIWYDNADGSFELWHAQHTDGRWLPAVSTNLVGWYITHDPSMTLSPGLAADSRSNIHVVWYDIDVTRQHLFHSRWDGSSWSDRQNVSGPNHRRTSEATLAAGPTDRLHAAWFDRGAVRYSHSNGDGWSEPIGVGEESSWPAIAVDTVGNVHLAWTQNERIIYSSDSGNWLKRVEVSESLGECAAPALTIDNTGRVHIVWMANREGNYDILYRSRKVSEQLRASLR